MATEGIRGRRTVVFPIHGLMPQDGMQWKYGKEEVSRLGASGRLGIKDGKPMIKIRPGEEDESRYSPFMP